ncbi:hypothetical protein ACJX0J_005768, partial [Zea mays]
IKYVLMDFMDKNDTGDMVDHKSDMVPRQHEASPERGSLWIRFLLTKNTQFIHEEKTFHVQTSV